MMLTNLDVINTTGHGRRQSDKREPGNSTSQGELQKQSRTLWEENYRSRALRGRQSLTDSTVTTQNNSINYKTYRSTTQLDTEDDNQTNQLQRIIRRTTEAELWEEGRASQTPLQPHRTTASTIKHTGENLEVAHHKENYRSRAEHSERKAELNRLHWNYTEQQHQLYEMPGNY